MPCHAGHVNSHFCSTNVKIGPCSRFCACCFHFASICGAPCLHVRVAPASPTTCALGVRSVCIELSVFFLLAILISIVAWTPNLCLNPQNAFQKGTACCHPSSACRYGQSTPLWQLPQLQELSPMRHTELQHRFRQASILPKLARKGFNLLEACMNRALESLAGGRNPRDLH